MFYIHVAETLLREATDEFMVKVAETSAEIKKLFEAGSEYVCEKMD